MMSLVNTLRYGVGPANQNEVMIVDFSNGNLRRPKEGSDSTIKFGCYKSGPRKRVLPVAESANLTYCPDSVPARKFCKYLIGVRDKKTNEVTLHNASLFHLKPKTSVSVEDLDVTDMTFRQKSDMLTMAFGSSKKKNSVTSRLNNAIEGEALGKAVATAVEHALEYTKDTPQLDVKPSGESSIIPQCYTDATCPQEAYKLDSIISPDEMGSLDALAREAAKDKTSIDTITKVNYILSRMKRLPVQEKYRLHRVKCLLYLSYMIEMYHFRSADLRRKESFTIDIPDNVKRKLLDTFSQKVQLAKGVTRSMPPRMKDKLAVHIIVLMMIIDEFELSVAEVQDSLKLGQNKLMSLVRCLGCHVAKTSAALGSKAYIGLKCPVVFTQPTPVKSKGRK